MAAKFKRFPVPKASDDTPLVQHAGFAYKCSGCGGPVPDGAWVFEQVEKGMVTGIEVRAGGPDAPVVHSCGTAA